MNEITGELKNWYRFKIYGIDVYCGNIYNDSKGRFPDGEFIRTSSVKAVKDDVVFTKNSVYKLVGEEYKGLHA